MVASSASRVAKLCAGVPSARVWVAALASAAWERVAIVDQATGGGAVTAKTNKTAKRATGAPKVPGKTKRG